MGRWHDGGWWAGGFLLLLAGAAVFGPMTSRTAYWERVDAALQAPDARHWLGTDELGRDVQVRLLYAGRISLAVGLAAALVAALVGTAIGLLAGNTEGWVDSLLMRLADIFLAVPALPILLILSAVDLEKPLVGLQNAIGRRDWDLAHLTHEPWVHAARLIVVLTLFGWMGTARLVRAQVLGLRERDFVAAARASGVRPWGICLRHYLPHCWGPILVSAATAVATNILYEAVLGFLGLGIPPPAPSWGGMLQGARAYSYYRAPWLIYFPGLCILLTVLCVNLLADRMQEKAEPRKCS